MRIYAFGLCLVIFCSVLTGCVGDGDDDVENERYITPDVVFDERGLAPSSDVYLFGNEEIIKFESCNFFGDLPYPKEQIEAQGILARPHDGIDVDGTASIIDPTDFNGDIALFYLDGETKLVDYNSYLSSWILAQQRSASAILYSEYTAWEVTSEGDFETVEIHTCDEIQWDSMSGLPYVNIMNLPIVVISPDDMRTLENTQDPYLVIGPKGFEPKDVMVDDEVLVSIGLPSKRISQWEPSSQDCPSDYEGAIVKTLYEDSNQDGEYQGNEQFQEIECRLVSPYGSNIVSVSIEQHIVTVPTSKCTTGMDSHIDTTTIYSDGTSIIVHSDISTCTGTTPISFENQLKRLLCENGHLPDETTLSEMTLSSCLSPLYENELRLVIPQLKVDSLTQSQMPTCANGGLLITMWADADGNGAWDQSETQSTQRLCNGTDGIDGENGSDGQDGENGLDAYELLVETHNADANSCPLLVSGKEVFLGRDVNRNGELDDTEIEHSYAICNGVDGSNGTNGQTALLDTDIISNDSATDCNGVYVRLSNGFDLNNDSNLSIEETRGSRYICLPSHQTDVNATFVKESIEPNSVCLNGGVHSFIWIDEDGNDTLEEGEIFMETFDCASNETVVECNDTDGDCISDENDTNEESDRENIGDSDFDGTPDDEDDYPECDNRFDSDRDGIPDDCDDDI